MGRVIFLRKERTAAGAAPGGVRARAREQRKSEAAMVFGRLYCLFGRHRRSRRHVRFEDPDFISICRYCHQPMRRESSGEWVVTGDHPSE